MRNTFSIIVFFLAILTSSLSYAVCQNLNISAGGYHTVAVKNNGTVWGWGKNSFGQLGDGGTSSQPNPVQVVGISYIKEVSAGWEHSVALRTDGTVMAWGNNTHGQLGDGTKSHRHSPVKVENLSKITVVTTGYYHSVALRNDGTVWTWGENSFGQLGDGTTVDKTTPVQVMGLNNIIDISAGGEFTVALKDDGTVWAWGMNTYGQLGDGSTLHRYSPALVETLGGISKIATGCWHTLALDNDGNLFAWGRGSYGALGDGTLNSRSTPVSVINLSNIQDVTAGYNHSIALSADGSVWAWGRNDLGTLGDGTTTNQRSPVQVSDIEDILSVTSSYSHSVALRSNGSIWSWGWNYYGQIGDGTSTDRLIPVNVPFFYVSTTCTDPDTDGDGIVDIDDAFFTDPAASLDSDSDGYPDSWNTGYSKDDSTTGLVLDAFPSDPNEWSDIDGDGIGDNSDPTPNGALNVQISQIDTSNCPTISAVVTVSDQNGAPLSSLTTNDFIVREDAATQYPISVMSAGGASAISVPLLLDYSGSMDSADLSAMEAAAQSFIAQMNPIDSAEIVKFSTAVEVVQGFTSDQSALISAVTASWGGTAGMTSLYDAVYQGISDATSRSGRRAVVVITDGHDEPGSTHTLQGVIDYAVQQGVPVFTVGLGSASTTTVLEQLASDTGGQYYYAPTNADLQTIYQNLAEVLSSQYVVEYTSSTADGLSHSLEVEVSDAGVTGTDSRTFTSCGQLNVILNQVQTDTCPSSLGVVTVTYADGTPVTGLTESNFTLREDGVIQTFDSVDTASNSGSAISVALTMDYSGSMGATAITDMESAAQTFVNQLSGTDSGEVIKFATTVEVIQAYTTDTTALGNAINSAWTGSTGSTAFYDAVYQGIADTMNRSGRRAIVAMTDGSDNTSSHTLQQLIEYAIQAGVPIFTVGLGSASETVLQQLAADTGGQYYNALTSTDLQAIYQAISNTLASQYLLTYQTTATGGGYHSVEVEVSSGALSGSSSRQISGCDPAGTLAGTVTDSQSGQPISGASVILPGPASQTVQTDASGTYRVDVPAGSYTVTAQASGYIDPTSQAVTITSGATMTVNFALAAINLNQAYRIVLTWGATPDDLDSHLWIPGEEICGHVWYSDQGSTSAFPYAQLDVDDTTSYGPETISIEQLQSGGYEYWVRNFSGSQGSAPDMTVSGAQVALYDGNSLLQTFTVPTAPTGNLGWHVFDIDGDSGQVTIVDQLEADVDNGICTPANTSGTTPLNDNTAFVRQVYLDFLNREPDRGGLDYWTGQLESGALTRAQVVESYLLSAEFQGIIAPVTRLYFAYFNRIPDYGGLMYWVGQYQTGTSLGSISDAFAGSAEFISTYGSLSNSEFVTLVYQNVLGRDPDAGGLAYWSGRLDAGTVTRGEVMTGFSESDEYKGLMGNSIYVTMTYIGLLRRAPDQGGFDYWTGVMDGGGSGLGLIDGFLNSSEYADRFTGP